MRHARSRAFRSASRRPAIGSTSRRHCDYLLPPGLAWACNSCTEHVEALGPITEGADLVVFNALVDDWNVRCTKYRYRTEDKEAADAEAGRRRALLEVEGRALMNVWRRKIVTTVQQRPVSAGLDAGDA